MLRQGKEMKPWAYLSGLVDGNPKLKQDILNNPRAAFALIRPMKENLPNPSVSGINEAMAYVWGYVGCDYQTVKELMK